MTKQIAYGEVYELKAGGFRGAAKNKLTGEIVRGEVRPTLAEARNDVRNFFWSLLGDDQMKAATIAPVYGKNFYRGYVWAA